MAPKNFDLFTEIPKLRKKKSKFMMNKWKLIAFKSTLLIIFGLPLLVLCVYSKQERTFFNKKFKNLTKTMKHLEKSIESLKHFTSFERIAEFGYFLKLKEKMNFKDGQIACSKIYGHIIEFDERYSNCSSKFYSKALVNVNFWDQINTYSVPITLFILTSQVIFMRQIFQKYTLLRGHFEKKILVY